MKTLTLTVILAIFIGALLALSCNASPSVSLPSIFNTTPAEIISSNSSSPNAAATVTANSTSTSSNSTAATFMATLPGMTLTYPKGGEIFHVGDVITITWTSTNIPEDAPINIYISISGRSAVGITGIRGVPNTGSYKWTVPESVGGDSITGINKRILIGPTNITTYGNGGISGVFTIVTPIAPLYSVMEAADDVIPNRIGLWTYRADAANQNQWPEIQQVTQSFAISDTVSIAYRAYIETFPGQTRNDIIYISDSAGQIRANSIGPNSYVGDIKISVVGLPAGITADPGTTIHFHISSNVTPGEYTFQINAQINGTNCTLPCAVKVLSGTPVLTPVPPGTLPYQSTNQPPAADDLIPSPGGVYVYRANMHSQGQPDQWPQIQQDTAKFMVTDTLNLIYRASIETSAGQTRNDIIYITDSTGQIRFANQAGLAPLNMTFAGLPAGITAVFGRTQNYNFLRVNDPKSMGGIAQFYISSEVKPGNYPFQMGAQINGADCTLPCVIKVLPGTPAPSPLPIGTLSPKPIPSPSSIPEAADDVLLNPDGFWAYRVDLPNQPYRPSGPDISQVRMTFTNADTINITYRAYILTDAGQTRNNIIWINDNMGSGRVAGAEVNSPNITVVGLPEGITTSVRTRIQTKTVPPAGVAASMQAAIEFEIPSNINPGEYTFRINVQVNGTNFTLPCAIKVS
jgi:hypothetical protein